jgi:tetratricopeptide (TPR) repeat protein
MRARVLPDARRGRHAGRFVWLSIDTEDARNAGFLERFPVDVWPTFLVVDPRREQAVLKWPGSATVAQLERLLADAEGRERTGAAAALSRADRANAGGRVDEAVAAYREALAKGGPRWSRRPRVVESLAMAQAGAGRLEACAATAREEALRLPRGPSFANVVGTGLACANSAPADAAWGPAAAAALEPLVREALALPGLLADDRAGLYEALADALTARGDEAGAREVAERWWSFLAEEGRRSPSPEARASLDGMRVAAAMAAGDPARALPALEESGRDLPRDYNPPARRATVLKELGRLAEARAAALEALAKAYGPRKLKLWLLAASIMERQGDAAAAAAALDEAEAYAARMPPPQRRGSGRTLDTLRQRRRALEAVDGSDGRR